MGQTAETPDRVIVAAGTEKPPERMAWPPSGLVTVTSQVPTARLVPVFARIVVAFETVTAGLAVVPNLTVAPILT